MIPAFHVPPVVLKQVSGELARHTETDQENILKLADALWAGRTLEYRLLACNLLGRVAPTPPERIQERLHDWAEENEEEPLLEALAGQSLGRLRVEAPKVFLKWVEGWLTGSTVPRQRLGLRALGTLLEEEQFEDLPTVFRLLRPVFANAASDLRKDLLRLTQQLAGRSPQESAHFLKEGYAQSHNPTEAWVIRQSLNLFPPESRGALREALKGG